MTALTQIYDWPFLSTDLPSGADQAGYNESPSRNVASFPLDDGSSIDRQRTSRTSDTLTFTTSLMTSTQYDTLRDFYVTTLKGGTQFFARLHPRTKRLAVFQFTAPPKITGVYGLNYAVSFQAVMKAHVEAETQAYLDAVAVSDAQTTSRSLVINNMVAGLKTTGLWAKSTGLWMMAANKGSAIAVASKTIAANTNIAKPSQAALQINNLVGGDFTDDRGWTGDGISKYLDTLVPWSSFCALDGTGFMFQWSLGTSVLAGTVGGGGDVGQAGANAAFTNPLQSSTNARLRGNSTTNQNLTASAANVLFGWSRGDSATFTAYIDTAPTAITDPVTTLDSSTLCFLRSGSVYSDRGPLALGWVGNVPLTDDDVVNAKKIFGTYLKQVGAIS